MLAIAPSENPDNISFNFPGYFAISPIAKIPGTFDIHVAGSTIIWELSMLRPQSLMDQGSY